MIAIIASLLLLALVALAAAIAANPVFRTLSVVIDSWADGVQGDTKQLR